MIFLVWLRFCETVHRRVMFVRQICLCLCQSKTRGMHEHVCTLAMHEPQLACPLRRQRMASYNTLQEDPAMTASHGAHLLKRRQAQALRRVDVTHRLFDLLGPEGSAGQKGINGDRPVIYERLAIGCRLCAAAGQIVIWSNAARSQPSTHITNTHGRMSLTSAWRMLKPNMDIDFASSSLIELAMASFSRNTPSSVSLGTLRLP